ncbi:CDP-glycerol glycerophosphotransferase family protein, partial [Helicobacter sp.]|uniref:CDP-glycerol glycerophosphotransferase family protein n=1 Tax=Helicobacter sp. TaxID=218 RepID=UPI0025C18211
GGGTKSLLCKHDSHTLVFYSEGKQYHNVFAPILAHLDRFHYPYTYLTSSQEDYDLYHQNNNPNATFAYIGDSDSGSAIARLNSLRADLVVMTTPQLDVLQIKRSKSVKHYCHIIHSLPHIDIYEIFALDYFDSVLTNSPIHTPFIRQVESKRNLKAKQVIVTGCTYLDVLATKLQAYQQSQNKFAFFPHQNSTTQNSSLDSTQAKQIKTILIAPSWGREALLSKYGFAIIEPFINSTFQLIVRPHPQSYISESAILQELQERTKYCSNIVWDTHTDNIYALDSADVMIGDFSGVLFDFICLFEKPVLTPELHFCTIGYDLEDIYDTPWVQGALKRIGKQFHPEQISNLPTLLESMLSEQSTMQASLQAVKQELWHFQGSGGEQSARALLEIESQILESSLDKSLPLHKRILKIQEILAVPSLDSTRPAYQSQKVCQHDK